MKTFSSHLHLYRLNHAQALPDFFLILNKKKNDSFLFYFITNIKSTSLNVIHQSYDWHISKYERKNKTFALANRFDYNYLEISKFIENQSDASFVLFFFLNIIWQYLLSWVINKIKTGSQLSDWLTLSSIVKWSSDKKRKLIEIKPYTSHFDEVSKLKKET